MALHQLNDYLLEAVDIQTILEFDTQFKNVFEDVFYSINTAENEKDENFQTKTRSSIMTHFLKHWKSVQDYSGITKSLPTILTGEAICDKIFVNFIKET